MTHHRHEKRLGRRIENLQAYSCLMSKHYADRTKLPTMILREYEWKYCMKCNYPHYHFGDLIEFKQPKFNPNDFWYSELVEMGYFEQFHDTNLRNHFRISPPVKRHEGTKIDQ